MNRLILGDSLVVMNSLLLYENLDGQVQMSLMGSNSDRTFNPLFDDETCVTTQMKT